ncbi:hypothetical protein LO763_15635 [Glycomyces sp. A-F 0318]|uniref:hypothetical protein n=1 Tax=Glycomyces amatae TaxID=2881355 RepID=UPI001E5CB2C2|nr:hypothetical protein [Glycomyces amatae]MCD0445048.1 hypothetical protein [Glycomyces amatae]
MTTPEDAGRPPAGGGADPRLDGGEWRAALDDRTVEAVGKLTEALETVEIARGHLYAFHQLTGAADFKVEDAIGLLEAAGHRDLARRLARELLGRNVLPGRWTFQVIEDYEATYYDVFRDLERETRRLTGGVPHVYEADLKRHRRSAGEPGHEAVANESVADR